MSNSNVQSRFKVHLAEFVRPDGGFWPAPYNLEQAFETFRHLVATGADAFEVTRWGRCGVRELLSANPSCTNARAVAPIRSIDDLMRRFHFALLAHGNRSVETWRREFGIHIDQVITVPARVYRWSEGMTGAFGCERDVKAALNRMMVGDRGVDMAIALNYIHPDCRSLHGVSVGVDANEFRFLLTYGDHPDGMYSSWTECIARTRPGEAFLDTLHRAYEVYQCLVHGTAPGGVLDLTDMYPHEPMYGAIMLQAETLGLEFVEAAASDVVKEGPAFA